MTAKTLAEGAYVDVNLTGDAKHLCCTTTPAHSHTLAHGHDTQVTAAVE